MFPGDYCAGIGPAGWLFMIGFWAAVIAVIMWAVTRLFPTSQQRRDPQERLDQPLANGGIDPDTYIAAQQELTGQR